MAEAKQRMSHRELVTIWLPFLRKRGSIHHGRRLEVAAAQITAATYFGRTKEKLTAHDFMPHEEKPEKKIASGDEIKRMLLGR